MAEEREAEALVVDLMANDPVVVAADLPVAKVADVLSDYDIGGLPVVDSRGHLMGVISQTDLLAHWASVGRSPDAVTALARDVMTQPAVTISGSASLREAAQLMAESHVARLVVVGDDPDVPLGLISDSDLMRAFPR
jgi:predicted transcriptional regulator